MLNAFYYPYADITHSEQLLLSSLYFDNIYVLEPNFFQPPHLKQLPNIPSSESMRLLVKEGIIKPVGPDILGINMHFGRGPSVLDEDNIELIKASICSDMANPQLQALAKEYGTVAWQIPNGQLLFWNGLGILLELSNEKNDYSMEILTERKEYYADLLRGANFPNIPVNQCVESRLRTSHSELDVRVPFLIAESLMITVSLLACVELGMVPITDSRIHHDFLCKKVSNPLIRDTLRNGMRSIELGISESSLALKTMEIQLPTIRQLTPEKVIELRQHCSDPLVRFRMHMRKLRHSLEESIWSNKFEEEIGKTIETEIIPCVQELKDAVASHAKEFGLKVVEDFTKLSPVPLLATIATAYPLEFLLAASAGIVVLKDYLQYLFKKGELKKNGLFFLIDFLK
jgi:hypothetical protein